MTLLAEVAFDPQWVIQGGALTCLVWAFWFTLSKSVPGVIKDFREDAAVARQQYIDNSKLAREMFAQELSESRRDFRAEIAAERQHCVEELARADHRARGYQQVLLNQAAIEKLGVKLPPEVTEGLK